MSQHTPGLTTAKCGCLYAGAVQMCPTHAKAPEMLEACKSALNWAQGNTAATREEGDARLAEMLRALLREIDG